MTINYNIKAKKNGIPDVTEKDYLINIFRFYTNADLSAHCLPYHDYYNRLISESSAKKDPPPVVLLTLDTTFSTVEENTRMPVRAYIRLIFMHFMLSFYKVR